MYFVADRATVPSIAYVCGCALNPGGISYEYFVADRATVPSIAIVCQCILNPGGISYDKNETPSCDPLRPARPEVR